MKEHYNYLISGKSNEKFTLLNEELIVKTFQLFEPFEKYISTNKANISAIQIAIGLKGYLKIGRPKWNLADLVKICNNYQSYPNNDFSFTTLNAEFPSVTSAYKNGTSPELKLLIENDGFYGKANGSKDCGIVLSIREDIYEQIGKQAVDLFLTGICELLHDEVVVFHKKGFWGKGTSIMDIVPYKYRDKMYNSEFKNWEKLNGSLIIDNKKIMLQIYKPKMKNQDLKIITDLITNATRKSFENLFENGEAFYYCSLITVGEGFAPTVSAWSLQALKRESQNLNQQEKQWIKWSYANSPYLAFGKENFKEVEGLYSTRPNIDDTTEEEWEEEFNIRLKAMELSMKTLDEEGLFSRNQKRENICVLVEVMPPDETNTEIAKRLNNTTSKAMKEWLEEAAE